MSPELRFENSLTVSDRVWLAEVTRGETQPRPVVDIQAYIALRDHNDFLTMQLLIANAQRARLVKRLRKTLLVKVWVLRSGGVWFDALRGSEVAWMNRS